MEKLNLINDRLKETELFDYFNSNLIKGIQLSSWSDDILYDFMPFDKEISGFKRGKLYTKEPKNKNNKRLNYFDKDNQFIGAYSYISNWNDPSYYIFIKHEGDCKFIYRFDIEKKLTNIFMQEYENSRLCSVYGLNVSGDYLVEQIYAESTKLIRIELTIGFDMNNTKNDVLRSINISYKNNDLILIEEQYSINNIEMIFEGLNPYAEKPFLSPLEWK